MFPSRSVHGGHGLEETEQIPPQALITGLRMPKKEASRSQKLPLAKYRLSALGKWGRTQMGSDGFNWIFPFQPCRGTACTSQNT